MVPGRSERKVSFEESVGLDLQRGRGRHFRQWHKEQNRGSNGQGPSASKPEGVRFELGFSDFRAHTFIHLSSSEFLIPWTCQFLTWKILIDHILGASQLILRSLNVVGYNWLSNSNK